jgi:hypothetical protein
MGTSLKSGLEWPNKAEQQDAYAARFGEVVRDMNTDCTLRHLYEDAVYVRASEFIRHMSHAMNRLEESAPNIPRAIENSHSSPKA